MSKDFPAGVGIRYVLALGEGHKWAVIREVKKGHKWVQKPTAAYPFDDPLTAIHSAIRQSKQEKALREAIANATADSNIHTAKRPSGVGVPGKRKAGVSANKRRKANR